MYLKRHLVVCAFKKGLVWGLCFPFVPFAAFVYYVVDWKNVWRPLLISVVGVVFLFGGAFISPSFRKAIEEAKQQQLQQGAMYSSS
ncbi:MAG TPA: hypothetical protein V6C86_07860 [Oculatellaceae cyanobacterium]